MKIKAIALGFLLWAMAFGYASAQVQSCNPVTTGTNHPSSPVHYLSAGTTNATVVTTKGVALCSITAINTTGTLYYLKLYNKATTPVCGTDPVVQTFPVPFGQSASGGGLTVNPATGLLFSAGLSFCLTSGIADNDTGNAATGIAINFGVK